MLNAILQVTVPRAVLSVSRTNRYKRLNTQVYRSSRLRNVTYLDDPCQRQRRKVAMQNIRFHIEGRFTAQRERAVPHTFGSQTACRDQRYRYGGPGVHSDAASAAGPHMLRILSIL